MPFNHVDQFTAHEVPLENLPRVIPFLTAVRMCLESTLGFIGILFVMIGLPVLLAITPLSLFDFTEMLERSQATVTRVEPTNIRMNGMRVYRIRYSFSLHNLGEFHGSSFSTLPRHEPGQAVEIEYHQGGPDRSRIVGLRSVPFPPIVSLVPLTILIIGAALMFIQMRRGIRGILLLKKGYLTLGKLVDCKPTHLTINEAPVYEFTFEFRAKDGAMYTTTARTHEIFKLTREDSAPASKMPPLPLEIIRYLPRQGPERPSEPEAHFEPLVYDPRNPHQAVVLDSLPGEPRIGKDGVVRVKGGAIGVLWLIVLGFGVSAIFSLTEIFSAK